jgi:hypothetical protein
VNPVRETGSRFAIFEPRSRNFAIATARAGATNFGDLLDTLPASREAGLALIWRLIARGALVADLSAPITTDTRITAS